MNIFGKSEARVPKACKSQGAALCVAVSLIGSFGASIPLAETMQVTSKKVPAFDLPESSFLSLRTRKVLKEEEEAVEKTSKQCPGDLNTPETILRGRECWNETYYASAVARYKALYQVRIEPEVLGGVHTEIITPSGGVGAANRRRVLINLHGGAFVYGGREAGQVESIPIVAVGKYRVVSVDYRMAPEHRFPAATEDVGAVYRELLKTYKPSNIGIYGCSAGGLLTAQTTAWLQKERLPPPGAVGMFCAAGSYYGEGDSGRFVAALISFPVQRLVDAHADPYLKNASWNDPLAFPIRSEEVLKNFPPSLLITSTRDQALSSVVYMHSRLVALGVDAELHVWEGLEHAFFLNPDLPESDEVYKVIAKFFDKQLGKH